MKYWLMKSEPSVYGIADLERDGCTAWDGVRNYQVRNMMRDEMRPGDRAFFYHSSCPEPGIAGLVEIEGPAHPDPTQFDPASPYHDPKSRQAEPAWLTVDVRFVERFPDIIPLEVLKARKELKDMPMLRRGNRLSVTPVSKAEWLAIRALVPTASRRAPTRRRQTRSD